MITPVCYCLDCNESHLPATLEAAAAVARASFSTAPESVTEIAVKCGGEIRGHVHFTRGGPIHFIG